jgi:hypothetical protein
MRMPGVPLMVAHIFRCPDAPRSPGCLSGGYPTDNPLYRMPGGAGFGDGLSGQGHGEGHQAGWSGVLYLRRISQYAPRYPARIASVSTRLAL